MRNFHVEIEFNSDEMTIDRRKFYAELTAFLASKGAVDPSVISCSMINTGEKVTVVAHSCSGETSSFEFDEDGNALAEVEYDDKTDREMSQCSALHREVDYDSRCRGCGVRGTTLTVLENFYAGSWCPKCQVIK